MVGWPVLIVWQMWIALGYQTGASLVGLIAIEDFYHLTMLEAVHDLPPRRLTGQEVQA
jgi:hypothetical protein